MSVAMKKSPRVAKSMSPRVAKSNLVVPEGLVGTDLVRANEAARAWCDEVNGRARTEICAVPAVRLEAERHLMGPLPSLRPSFSPAISRKVDRLAVVRFGGARYSVPDKLVGPTVQVQVLGTEVLSCTSARWWPPTTWSPPVRRR
jgi:hypothetical protein